MRVSAQGSRIIIVNAERRSFASIADTPMADKSAKHEMYICFFFCLLCRCNGQIVLLTFSPSAHAIMMFGEMQRETARECAREGLLSGFIMR